MSLCAENIGEMTISDRNLIDRASRIAMEDPFRLVVLVVGDRQHCRRLQEFVLSKSSGLCLSNIRVVVVDSTFDWDRRLFPNLPDDTVVLFDRPIAASFVAEFQVEISRNLETIKATSSKCEALMERVRWLQEAVC